LTVGVYVGVEGRRGWDQGVVRDAFVASRGKNQSVVAVLAEGVSVVEVGGRSTSHASLPIEERSTDRTRSQFRVERWLHPNIITLPRITILQHSNPRRVCTLMDAIIEHTTCRALRTCLQTNIIDHRTSYAGVVGIHVRSIAGALLGA
jgi:hypothetical protein